jgi:uncharacterized membrane protein
MNANDTTEDRVATLRSLLDDAARKVGEQRQTINAMRKALASALGYVKHWQRDGECNLRPTAHSLATAHAEISAAIKGAA